MRALFPLVSRSSFTLQTLSSSHLALNQLYPIINLRSSPYSYLIYFTLVPCRFFGQWCRSPCPCRRVGEALANCPQALDFVDISVRFDPELVKAGSLSAEVLPEMVRKTVASWEIHRNSLFNGGIQLGKSYYNSTRSDKIREEDSWGL